MLAKLMTLVVWGCLLFGAWLMEQSLGSWASSVPGRVIATGVEDGRQWVLFQWEVESPEGRVLWLGSDLADAQGRPMDLPTATIVAPEVGDSCRVFPAPGGAARAWLPGFSAPSASLPWGVSLIAGAMMLALATLHRQAVLALSEPLRPPGVGPRA